MKKVIAVVTLIITLTCFTSCSKTTENIKVHCKKCNANNPSSANYCSFCGENLNSSEKNKIEMTTMKTKIMITMNIMKVIITMSKTGMYVFRMDVLM